MQARAKWKLEWPGRVAETGEIVETVATARAVQIDDHLVIIGAAGQAMVVQVVRLEQLRNEIKIQKYRK